MRGLQQRGADRTGLGEDAERPAPGQLRREGGVEPHGGIGVDQPERVRAEHAHARRACLTDQLTLAGTAVEARLGVPGGDHDQPAHARRTAVRDDVRHLLGGDGDDGEIDRFRDVGDRGVDGHAVELTELCGRVGGGTVDRVERAGEAARQQVAQQRTADAHGVASGADHRDGAGCEQALHRPRLGAVLAGAHDREGLLGRRQVELEMEHAVGEAALLGVAGLGEDLGHLAVLRQHLGDEAADAALARGRGDVLQQRGGDTAALVRVLHQERDLRLGAGAGRPAGLVDAVVADGRDELVVDERGQADPVDEVVVGEVPDVLGGQPRVGSEEAVVLRLVRHQLVEGDEPVRVVRDDRADPGRAAVSQHDVGLPVGRVALAALAHSLRLTAEPARVRCDAEAVVGDFSGGTGRDVGPE